MKKACLVLLLLAVGSLVLGQQPPEKPVQEFALGKWVNSSNFKEFIQFNGDGTFLLRQRGENWTGSFVAEEGGVRIFANGKSEKITVLDEALIRGKGSKWVRESAMKATTLRALPLGSGAFYKDYDGDWVSLRAIAAQRHEGRARALGFGGAKAMAIYAGAEAAMKIPEPKPAFLLRVACTEPEIMLLKLSVKDGHREVESFSVEPFIATHGYRSSDMVPINVVRDENGDFSVTPQEPLSAGEYLLRERNHSFEFGITAKP